MSDPDLSDSLSARIGRDGPAAHAAADIRARTEAKRQADPMTESLRRIGHPDQVIADLRAENERLREQLDAAGIAHAEVEEALLDLFDAVTNHTAGSELVNGSLAKACAVLWPDGHPDDA